MKYVVYRGPLRTATIGGRPTGGSGQLRTYQGGKYMEKGVRYPVSDDEARHLASHPDVHVIGDAGPDPVSEEQAARLPKGAGTPPKLRSKPPADAVFRPYSNPVGTGWSGWYERDGKLIGYHAFTGEFHPLDDVPKDKRAPAVRLVDAKGERETTATDAAAAKEKAEAIAAERQAAADREAKAVAEREAAERDAAAKEKALSTAEKAGIEDGSDTRLGTIKDFPPHLVEPLVAADIHTVEYLRELSAKEGWHEKVNGIGDSRAREIAKWLESHPSEPPTIEVAWTDAELKGAKGDE